MAAFQRLNPVIGAAQHFQGGSFHNWESKPRWILMCFWKRRIVLIYTDPPMHSFTLSGISQLKRSWRCDQSVLRKNKQCKDVENRSKTVQKRLKRKCFVFSHLKSPEMTHNSAQNSQNQPINIKRMHRSTHTSAGLLDCVELGGVAGSLV